MICVQGFHLTSPRKQASDLPREPLQGRPLLSRESSQLYGPCTTPRQECELVVSGPVLYCNNPLSLTLHSWIKKKMGMYKVHFILHKFKKNCVTSRCTTHWSVAHSVFILTSLYYNCIYIYFQYQIIRACTLV